MEKMKPCPFCGSLIDGTEHDKYGFFVTVCSKCKASGPRSITMEEAEKAWNKRVNNAETYEAEEQIIPKAEHTFCQYCLIILMILGMFLSIFSMIAIFIIALATGNFQPLILLIPCGAITAVCCGGLMYISDLKAN